jgi:AbrB family looped-hinge helix DNA binding protein
MIKYLTSKNKEIPMEKFSTTRMSSKGQVVIPESIRKQLNLHTGSQFIVLGEGDVVILKAITPPSIRSFDALIEEARQQAEKYGLQPSDLNDAIEEARKPS